MTTRLLGLALLLAATVSSNAFGQQDTNIEISSLREQLLALSQRLDELEAANRELQQVNVEL